MAQKEYSKHQQNVISRYYDNLDSIMFEKLQTIVSELYIADSGAKTAKLWGRAEKAMGKLKVKGALIEHIMAQKSVEVLAKNLEEWLKNAK